MGASPGGGEFRQIGGSRGMEKLRKCDGETPALALMWRLSPVGGSWQMVEGSTVRRCGDFW